MLQLATQILKRSRQVLVVLSAVALCILPPAPAPISSLFARTEKPPANIPPPILCEIYMGTDIDSSKAKTGDIIVCTLKQSLKIDNTYNASPGSQIIGHIVGIASKRTLVKSVVSSHRRFSQDDAIDIVFTELDCPDHRRFAVMGRLAKQKVTIPLANGHIRSIAINEDGQLIHDHEVLKTKIKVRNYVGQYVLQAATVASGIVTGGIGILVVPAVMGAAGAMSPSFVTNAPVDPDDKHPRAKGFVQGVISAIPGSGIVQAFVCKGDDTEILPGQVLVMAFSPGVPTFECTGIVINPAIRDSRLQSMSTSSTSSAPSSLATQVATKPQIAAK